MKYLNCINMTLSNYLFWCIISHIYLCNMRAGVCPPGQCVVLIPFDLPAAGQCRIPPYSCNINEPLTNLTIAHNNIYCNSLCSMWRQGGRVHNRSPLQQHLYCLCAECGECGTSDNVEIDDGQISRYLNR